MLTRWTHLHSTLLGSAAAAALLSRHPWTVAVVYTLFFLAGAATTYAIIITVRLVHRVDRALPDTTRTHPCANLMCQAPMTGRAKYCSESCREIAADERAARRRQDARIEEFGEIPF